MVLVSQRFMNMNTSQKYFWEDLPYTVKKRGEKSLIYGKIQTSVVTRILRILSYGKIRIQIILQYGLYTW